MASGDGDDDLTAVEGNVARPFLAVAGVVKAVAPGHLIVAITTGDLIVAAASVEFVAALESRDPVCTIAPKENIVAGGTKQYLWFSAGGETFFVQGVDEIRSTFAAKDYVRPVPAKNDVASLIARDSVGPLVAVNLVSKPCARNLVIAWAATGYTCIVACAVPQEQIVVSVTSVQAVVAVPPV